MLVFIYTTKMLSERSVKQILEDDKLSDKEILEIRDGFRNLAEVIFEKWQQDKKLKKGNL